MFSQTPAKGLRSTSSSSVDEGAGASVLPTAVVSGSEGALLLAVLTGGDTPPAEQPVRSRALDTAMT